MNRALTLAAVLPAVRLIVDAGDAVVELAERFGVRDLAVLRSVGGWDLEADVDLHRFGLGVLVEHLPPRTATHPDWSMAGAVVGPLMLSATRRRTAAQRLDDTVGPVGDFDCCLAEAAPETRGAVSMTCPSCDGWITQVPDADGMVVCPGCHHGHLRLTGARR